MIHTTKDHKRPNKTTKDPPNHHHHHKSQQTTKRPAFYYYFSYYVPQDVFLFVDRKLELVNLDQHSKPRDDLMLHEIFNLKLNRFALAQSEGILPNTNNKQQ